SKPNGLRPICGRLERKRSQGAHGCRKGATTIGLRSRTSTSCPALCHAVIRARFHISKECGVDSQAWRRARDGQYQAASGGDLRSVFTTLARDALNMGSRAEKRLASAEQEKLQENENPAIN